MTMKLAAIILTVFFYATVQGCKGGLNCCLKEDQSNCYRDSQWVWLTCQIVNIYQCKKYLHARSKIRSGACRMPSSGRGEFFFVFFVNFFVIFVIFLVILIFFIFFVIFFYFFFFQSDYITIELKPNQWRPPIVPCGRLFSHIFFSFFFLNIVYKKLGLRFRDF